MTSLNKIIEASREANDFLKLFVEFYSTHHQLYNLWIFVWISRIENGLNSSSYSEADNSGNLYNVHIMLAFYISIVLEINLILILAKYENENQKTQNYELFTLQKVAYTLFNSNLGSINSFMFY